MYLIKSPKWLRAAVRYGAIWDIPVTEQQPAVYLTFDDGPHPTATLFALEQLAKFNAKATFFCIGKNVQTHQQIYEQIIREGHSIGNHTHNHLNGWNSSVFHYVKNVLTAQKVIKSSLFRPPYGRLKKNQAQLIKQKGLKIIMWSLLTGDFDIGLTPEKCLQNVLENLTPGNIVVFHDSEKAWPRMSYVLPKVLAFCKEKGWEVKEL